jgi:hypothetical protein
LDQEEMMSMHWMTTSAIVLLVAGPAFADCNQEVQSLKEALTQAETGASGAESGLPATPHQEQVLAGDQEGEESTAGTGAAGQAEVPASPHQQQVLDPAAGPAGGSDAAQQAADLLAEAGDMSAAGDEQGCMQKAAQAKELLGIN